MPLLNEASGVFLGSQAVDAVYRGGTKVWPTKPKKPLMYWDFEDNQADGWMASTAWDEGTSPVPGTVSGGILRTHLVWTAYNLDYAGFCWTGKIARSQYAPFTHLKPYTRFRYSLPGQPATGFYATWVMNGKAFSDEHFINTNISYTQNTWHDYIITNISDSSDYHGSSIPVAAIPNSATEITATLMFVTWVKDGPFDFTLEVDTTGFLDGQTGQPIPAA